MRPKADDERKRPPRPGEGRPRLGPLETARVVLVATPEQLSRWDAAAEAEGQTRSEWIRDVCDDAAQRGER